MLFAHFLTSILVHVIRTLTLNSWIVWGNINCKKHDLVNKQIDTDCKQFDGKLRDLIYLLVALIFCYICRSLNACHSLTSFSKNEQKKLSLHASFLHHATVITQSSSRKKLKGGKRNIFQQSTTVISASLSSQTWWRMPHRKKDKRKETEKKEVCSRIYIIVRVQSFTELEVNCGGYFLNSTAER